MYKQDLALDNTQGLICHKTQQNLSIYMYKEDLAFDNLQGLICHKTQPNQSIYMYKEDMALDNPQMLICHKIQAVNLIFNLINFTHEWDPKGTTILGQSGPGSN